MKSIFKKTKIHFFFYIVFIITIMTGNFKLFYTMTLITLFHETGHILFSKIFDWKIEKILILPLGCITIFNEKINKSIIEEFIVTIAGPLFQVFLFFVIKDNQINKYNLILLIFNLIPVVPLDGSKILNTLFILVLPFKFSHGLTIWLSFLSLFVIICILEVNLMLFIALFLVFLKVLEEYKNHEYLFNKFLFERHLYKIEYTKKRIIRGMNLNLMYRNYSHLFKTETKLVKESEILGQLFDNHSYL